MTFSSLIDLILDVMKSNNIEIKESKFELSRRVKDEEEYKLLYEKKEIALLELKGSNIVQNVVAKLEEVRVIDAVNKVLLVPTDPSQYVIWVEKDSCFEQEGDKRYMYVNLLNLKIIVNCLDSSDYLVLGNKDFEYISTGSMNLEDTVGGEIAVTYKDTPFLLIKP